MAEKNSKDSLWDLMLKYAKLQQQEYYELLPECTVYEQHEYKYLYQNIGFALFGSPSDITGENKTVDDQHSSDDILNQFHYKPEFQEVIDKIYEKVRDIGEGKVRNKCIYFGIIFNITFCAKSNSIEAKKKNKQDNGQNKSEESKMGCGSSPIFKVKRMIINNIPKAAKSTSDSYEEWYIDACARVYKSWKDYKSENVLPACTMVIPKNGFYQPDPTCEITEECSTVWLEVLESPQCSTTAAILNFSDKTAMAAGVASMGLGLLALLTPAAPIVVGATATGAASGVWSTGRSIYNLIDRSSHEQSISVTDRDARCSWLSIAGSVLATASMGGNTLLQNAIKKGSNINTFMKYAYNTVLISNLGVNGCGVALNAYSMYDKYQKGDPINVYDWLSVGTNILFFSSAVVNFQLAGDLIESTQGKILDDYRNSLRSKRLRKEFNRRNRNAAGNNSDRAAQNAEVIRYINKKAELNFNLQKNSTNNSQSTTKNKSPNNLENNSQSTSKTDSQSNIENNSQNNSQSTTKNKSPSNLENNSQTTSKTDSQSNVENKIQNNPQSTIKNKSQNNLKNNLQTTSKTDSQSNIENKTQNNSQSTIKNKSQSTLKKNLQTTSKTDSQSNIENNSQNNSQSTIKNKSQSTLKKNLQTTSKTDSQSNIENKIQNNPQSTIKNKSQNNLKNNLQTTSKTDSQSNIENKTQNNSQSTIKNKSQSTLKKNLQTTSKTDSQSNIENNSQNNSQSTTKNKSPSNLENNSQTTSKTDSQSNVEKKTQNNPQSTIKNKSQNNLKNNLQTTSKTDSQSNIENKTQNNPQSTIKYKSQNNLKKNLQTTSKTDSQSNIENNLQNKSQSTTKNTSPSNLKNNSQTAPKKDPQSNVENKTQSNPQSTIKNKSQNNLKNNSLSTSKTDSQSNIENNSQSNSCSSSVAPKIVVSFTNQKIMINGIPILDPIKFVMELLHKGKYFTESSATTTQEDEKNGPRKDEKNGPWKDEENGPRKDKSEKMKQILKTLVTHVCTQILPTYADQTTNVPDISKFREILEDMKYMENASDILPLVFKISVLLVPYEDCVEYIHKAVYFVWFYVKESVIQVYDTIHSFITNPKIQGKISSVIIALSENMDNTIQILLPAFRLYKNTSVLYV